jgi:phosphatidylserine decarboxylase
MSTIRVPKTTLSRYGGWIPSSRHVHKSFLDTHAKLAEKSIKARATHNPAVAAFAQAIKSNKQMVELFNQIFMQVSEESTVNTVFIVRCC